MRKSSKKTEVKALSSHVFAFKILRLLRLHHSIGQSSPGASLDLRGGRELNGGRSRQVHTDG